MKFSVATGAESVYSSITMSPNAVWIVAVVPLPDGCAGGLANGVADRPMEQAEVECRCR